MSREKHIEEMCVIAKQGMDENSGWRCKCDVCAADIVDGLYCDESAVINALYNAGYRKQEWTNIAEDGFPKEEGEYFVWNAEQRKREIRFFFRLPPHYPVETYPEVREYFGNCADYKKITHWMPLPEPPKGE